MPFIPVPNTVQVELVYQWDGQVCENVLYFQPETEITPETMLALAAELEDWWTENLKTQMPSNIFLIAVKVTDLSSETGYTLTYTGGLPSAGTHASPSLPNNCALVITKRTLLRGRSFRGRIYHPGLVEAAVTGNTVSPSFVTGYLTIYSQLTNFVVGSEVWTHGVVSRYTGGNPRVTGVFTPVLNLSSDGTVDSQRRRLPGRGA